MPKNEVEALLFSAGKNMTVDNIMNLTGSSKEIILQDLKELKKDYEERQGALMILDEGESWKIHVREEYLPLVRKIVADTELPKSVLETLAIIAYRSPMLQSQVINARSSGAYEHISLLMDMGFITREKQGRSYLLKVTEKFFEYFDVEGDKDLKQLFKDMKHPEITVIDDEGLSKELYELKHHKSHGEVVDIPRSQTADPERSPEPGEAEQEEKGEEKPKEKKDTKDFLDRINQEIDEIAGDKDESQMP